MLHTEEIRENMLAKFRWAETSVQRIKDNLSDDLELVEQDFWAFLTACQTIRYYQARWHKLNNSGDGMKWLDAWKLRRLPREQEAFATIIAIRNEDTHGVLLRPEREVRHELFVDPYTTGFKPFAVVSIKYVVLFKGQRHVLNSILKDGLSVFKQLINDFDH